MKEFDEIPFVPCNDCSSWESCTQDAYEQGKADAKAEHDKECDTCILLGWKEKAEEIKTQAREEAIDECIEELKQMLSRANTYVNTVTVRLCIGILELLKNEKKDEQKE